MDYHLVQDLQNRVVSAKMDRKLDADVVIWVEHHPVFTIGRHGGEENLIVSAGFLQEQKIRMVLAERGGNITFHGPGQLVVYPVVNLQKLGLRVPEYVHLLEKVMMLTAHAFSVSAERNPLNPGIFFGDKKLGSVGIAMRHGIAFHGFALNITTALEPFQWIHPCGLKGIAATSLENETGVAFTREQVQGAAQQHFCQLFHIEPVSIELMELEKLL